MAGSFAYRDSVLHIENVGLDKIAGEVGTPVYCYSSAMLESNYRVFDAAFSDVPHMVCYAVKANSNQAILRLLALQGAGMDIVSGGELRRALSAGVPGERIVFSGVGKTRQEMSDALDAGIACFNVELEAELFALSEVAASKGHVAPFSVRVNPDIDGFTHAKISTGKSDTKFGVPLSQAKLLYQKAAALPYLQVTGIDIHIGSQITDLTSFEKAATLASEMARELMSMGYGLRHIDLGGGLGIPYYEDDRKVPQPSDYAAVIKRCTAGLGLKLILEPGRVLVGDAGILLTRVIYVKPGEKKIFVIVDAAMNDLIRPTLYDAYHAIRPVLAPQRADDEICADIVGPVCETGDFLALGRSIPACRAGELMVVMTAGAYGAVKSSTYNSRLLIPEVLVRGEDFFVIRPRESYEELIGRDKVPDWLS